MNDPVVSKSLAHDRLAHQFDHLMNQYDLTRRLETLLDDFLRQVDLSGRLVLDAGCGTGRATRALGARGARVVALDIGAHLVTRAVQRGQCAGAVASVLNAPFPDNCFDIVFSSEVIEHTPDPLGAVVEFHRLLKPNGHLILSTPNRAWHWLVSLATVLKVRPYDGLENFVRPRDLRSTLEALDLKVVRHVGIHIAPFQIRALQPILRRCDDWGDLLLPWMINQCVHAVKK
ncbi:MAG: methyltransferase domain-containing protein [Chloroflexi bacterium]|nr:methyltransferase domain-containing protein [Chloroflexota bacterium]